MDDSDTSCYSIFNCAEQCDFDSIGDLEEEAGMKIYSTTSEEKIAVKHALNAGLLETLYMRYYLIYDDDGTRKLILLVAMAMRVGADISRLMKACTKRQIREIKNDLMTHPIALKQMSIALETYVSGECYDFDNPSIEEVFERLVAEEEAHEKAVSELVAKGYDEKMTECKLDLDGRESEVKST
ncbi:uncharacterized protein K452DRAFT_330362 [Aplosporella prunicola CBS 121167]|uniref:Uncharacterized protein n=1 Tax=Aplosporella prunicola CBS 121167 TaxID=1176127 RepID=A0A6A6BT89_9PEZI|nr:uncharacterized protein K452DRAFT_330362 [Aplosporella prunicola CBS 121167]KAF2147008.1 hypothetical protein K452DRAFT_330362 [Aplosporella prunicola CBS 121167]